MPSGLASPPNLIATPSRTALLRSFVQAYWLRPENAFWMTLRSDAWARCALRAPSIDLSCGDGLFTFLHCGGRLHPDFDVFTSVGSLDQVRACHADMFDHISDHYQPTITSSPATSLDIGTDLKEALLAKASRLNLYGRLVRHNNDEPLPFDDDSFETVYCNAAYWVTRIDSFLTEIGRITRPTGSIVLQVKLDSMRAYTLSQHQAALGDRFLDIIGRGRLESWPTLASRATWESRFATAGLCVESATPFVTPTHAHVWDIGLRPIAPLLVRMAQAITPETRAAIKKDWVDLFCELLAPLCIPDLDLSPHASPGDRQAGHAAQQEPAEIQYVLSPRRS